MFSSNDFAGCRIGSESCGWRKVHEDLLECEDSVQVRPGLISAMRPRLVLLDERKPGAAVLADKLVGEFPSIEMYAPSLDECPQTHHVDVCIVHLEANGTKALAYLVAHAEAFADTALVFWSDDQTSPQIAVARCLGFERVIPAAALVGWLRCALPHLVLEARGKRMVNGAKRKIPSIPNWSEVGDGRPMPLPEAETQFRETYVRRVLAENGSRRQAARAAGVPYRTFCDILRKLGIGETVELG